MIFIFVIVLTALLICVLSVRFSGFNPTDDKQVINLPMGMNSDTLEQQKFINHFKILNYANNDIYIGYSSSYTTAIRVINYIS